jgi:hypothetical protein
MATLEPKDGEYNGGEYHSVNIDLDENGYPVLKIHGTCYGTHSYDTSVLMCAVGPDELDRFAKDLFKLADAMRLKDRDRESE